MTVTPLVIADLTQNMEGQGVFDVLMRANKAHLENEFKQNRIKGPEYATVYLGSLDSVMRTSMEFLLQRQRVSLEAQLLEQQIILAQVEVLKANAAVALMHEQVLNTIVERDILLANKDKIAAEVVQMAAQTALIGQQKANLIDELLTANLQRTKIGQETANLAAQKLQIDAQSSMVTQQKTNLVAEALNIPKQGAVLVAQQCKLQAEYDLTVSTTLKSASEITLLTQKVATERAQTTGLGVDADSVVGRQKGLYLAQTTGFTRDAEQKAADLMVRAWSVQRTTDETGTTANSTNKLDDVSVGRVMNKVLTSIGA